MDYQIRRVEYFNTTVEDQPGTAHALLAELAKLGTNLLAFTAIPVGDERTQFAVFPQDSAVLRKTAELAKLELDGPHLALLIQGDDELGALAGIHAKLFEAGVNVSASSGLSDGKGSFGYIVYLRPNEFEKAAETLGV